MRQSRPFWLSQRVYLVLLEIENGELRFESIQQNTGIARNVLTDCLTAMVGEEILEKRQYSEKPKRFEYQVTEKGRELTHVFRMYLEWVKKYQSDDDDDGPAGVPSIVR